MFYEIEIPIIKTPCSIKEQSQKVLEEINEVIIEIDRIQIHSENMKIDDFLIQEVFDTMISLFVLVDKLEIPIHDLETNLIAVKNKLRKRNWEFKNNVKIQFDR
jgi:phosphoribosyl-ATP pyrophosphohydrolase